jgi:hypothetical protein
MAAVLGTAGNSTEGCNRRCTGWLVLPADGF